MNLDQLRYFVETARLEHIGKAAKAVAISPSAISHAIDNLEHEFGRALFEKKGKRIFLTPFGQVLHERAQLILSDVTRLKDELASDDIALQGHLRVAATHFLADEFIAPCFAKTLANNSLLTGEFFSLRSAQVLDGIVSGQYDVGFCFSPQDHPEIDAKVLYRGQLFVAVSPKHPLVQQTRDFRMQQLTEYPCAMPKAFQGIEVCERHPALESAGIMQRPRVAFDHYSVASSLIAKSNFWGLLPDVVIDKMKLTKVKHPREWNAGYTIAAVTSSRRPSSRAVQDLIRDVMKVYAPESAPLPKAKSR